MSRRRPGPRGRRRVLIDLTGKDLDGCRTVVGRAPTPPTSAEAWWRVQCRVTGAEEDRASSQIRRGLAGDCRSCANRGAQKITRAIVEVLVLGAEVPRLRVTRVQVALGWTRSKVLVVLGNATRKRLARLDVEGRFYEVAPAGFDVLRDIAEGRRADRWGQRSRIVAALDGGRASGRRTLLVGTARGESRGSV